MFNVGKFDRRIIIKRDAKTVNAAGYEARTWTPVATAWAEAVTHVADDVVTGYGASHEKHVLFRMRYVRGIVTEDRITHDGKLYLIKSVTEIGRRAFLEITAVETA